MISDNNFEMERVHRKRYAIYSNSLKTLSFNQSWKDEYKPKTFQNHIYRFIAPMEGAVHKPLATKDLTIWHIAQQKHYVGITSLTSGRKHNSRYMYLSSTGRSDAGGVRSQLGESQQGNPICTTQDPVSGVDDHHPSLEFASLPPCLCSLHSKAVMERGSWTRSLHPFLTEGTIEHCKLPQLLLLEEVLRFILHRIKQ